MQSVECKEQINELERRVRPSSSVDLNSRQINLSMTAWLDSMND